jgi:hypothetical protein
MSGVHEYVCVALESVYLKMSGVHEYVCVALESVYLKMGEVLLRSGVIAQIMLEATIGGCERRLVVAEMPLAERIRHIPSFLQQRRYERVVEVDTWITR